MTDYWVLFRDSLRADLQSAGRAVAILHPVGIACIMIDIDRATHDDLDFMLWVHEQGEGYADTNELSPEQRAHQKAKFETFLVDEDRAAWIAIDRDTGIRAGLVMCIFRDLSAAAYGTPGNEFYRGLPELTKVGRFCEVFEIDPSGANTQKQSASVTVALGPLRR